MNNITIRTVLLKSIFPGGLRYRFILSVLPAFIFFVVFYALSTYVLKTWHTILVVNTVEILIVSVSFAIFLTNFILIVVQNFALAKKLNLESKAAGRTGITIRWDILEVVGITLCILGFVVFKLSGLK